MAEVVVRRWVKGEVEETVALALADQLKIHPATARLLGGRGFTDPAIAERYLAPQLAHLPDPSTMKHVDRAAARLAEAIAKNQRVTLYGDYDVDGVTSSALLASFLRIHGLEANV